MVVPVGAVGRRGDRVKDDTDVALPSLAEGELATAPRAGLGDGDGFEAWMARAGLRGPVRANGDARAASRATATRARLLGLIGPGRSGGSIG